MRTVVGDQDVWAATYLALLEYGIGLCRQGAPAKHIRVVLDVLIPPIAAAAGRPEALLGLEAELKLVLAARERAIAALTN